MQGFEMVKVETQAQVEQVADMAGKIWREHFTPIIGAGQVAYMLDKFQSATALADQLKEGYEYYQMTDQGQYAGYCGIHAQGDSLFLSKLYLEKSFRGRRLASKALLFLRELCRQRGIRRIYLTCNKHNEQTLAVYRHLGFETIAVQAADIGGGYIMDDYIMEIRL